MASRPHSSGSRIEKHTHMTLSDLLNCFSEMRRRDEIAAEMEKEKSETIPCTSDFFSHLSLEIICHILDYLPLRDVLRMEQQCKKIQKAVSMHLKVRKSIDFTEGEIYSWIPASLNDAMLAKLISRCVELDSINGFHSQQILKRRQRGADKLTIPGIIAALSSAQKLKGIEISDISLMESILNYLPRLEILGTFKNRNGGFPINPSNKLVLTSNPKITSLHLTGVVISELPRMSHMKELYLRWVKITHSHPFRDFCVPSLQTFVMSNCAGPSSTLKYVPLITGLAAARSLTRLELVRVPFLGGLIQHIVEDSWRVNGFSQLQTVTFGACKHAQEVDLGFLMITAAHGLEGLSIQPLLTKDSLFAAIKMADVSFPVFETLHLGYVDPFPEPGKWNQDDLVMLHGLAEVTENPAMITDIGMKAIGQCFSFLRNLEIYNCPHLHFPTSWITSEVDTWTHLRHLHLRRCHAIRLQDFCRFIELLPQLELLHLEYMFREPPKGCARVGLSAGTGLGVSSALVQNNGNDGANVDGGNNNDDDGDVNRDDNNNDANVGAAAAAGVGGDVNNNEPANNNPENNNVNPEPEEDPLDEDYDFDEFSDNADDLDFDGLSGDEENIDMANHIGDDIQISDVAANHAAGNTSQDEETSGDSLSFKSKSENQTEKEKAECRPGPSKDLGNDPQPSTSRVYPASVPAGCCKKRDVSMAAIPTVDSRSTCQLIDIDIGNDSDTDMESPPDGKIKVKVECNSAIELRPNNDNQSTETKFISSSSGSHRIIEEPLPSTSGLSRPAQSSCHAGKTDTKETPSSSSSSWKDDENNSRLNEEQTCDRNLDTVTSVDCKRVKVEDTLKVSAQDNVGTRTGPSDNDPEDSGGPPAKKRKHVSDMNSSVGGDRHSDKPSSSACSNYNHIPVPFASSSSRQCQSVPSTVQSMNLDEELPTSIKCDVDATSAESSRGVADFCEEELELSVLKKDNFDSSSQKSNIPVSLQECSEHQGSSELKQSKPSSSCSVTRTAEPDKEDNDPLLSMTKPREAVSSVCPNPVPGCAVEVSASAIPQTQSSSSEHRKQTESGEGNENEKSVSESSENLQSNPEAGTSRNSQESERRDLTKDEFLEEIAKEYGVDPSAPHSPRDNRFLFTQSEMEEMGFGKDNDSEDDKDEATRSYNMRPRKRGKSLTGKKKGLVKKRRKSSENLKTKPKMHDKSCQAVSDEIRETTKRAKEQEEARAGTSSGADNSSKSKGGHTCLMEKRRTRSQVSVKCEEVPTRKCEPVPFRPGVRRRKNMVDKATSTSDPVIEDDHIQVLSLKSKSLMCVTLYMVGVTDIIIDECPNLTLLRGSACRVLKKATVGGAPKLSKVSFAQCKKIDEMHLVNEVCDQISQTNRVIYLRPMRQFDMFAFENMLFCQPDIDYHLCVIYDYSPNPSNTMYNRARITSWLDLFSGMNMELLRFMDFEQAKNFPVDEDDEEKCYRNAYIMHGYNDDGSEWTLSTDIPWLDHLSQCPDVDSTDLHPDDTKEGLYCPRRKGHHLTTDCLMDLQDVISDMRNKGVSLYCYSVIVYVNMCDVSGTPTPDMYL